MRLRRGRLPVTLATALPFAPRERPLAWAACGAGCRLVATSHGLWEWPRRRPPVRHCWRGIERVRVTPTGLAVQADPATDVACVHVLDTPGGLPELARSLDSSSRLMDLGFTLPSGSELRIQARMCRFEGRVEWTSRLTAAAAGADADVDARLGAILLRRARSEFGTGTTGEFTA